MPKHQNSSAKQSVRRKTEMTNPKNAKSYDFELLVEKETSRIKKITNLDWLIIKRWKLKRFGARGNNISITMWDGRQYDIKKGHFSAVYEWDVRYGPKFSPIDIIIKTDDKQKIKFREMAIYPNGRADTVRMIEILEAEPSKLVKWAPTILEAANLFKKSTTNIR
jgi:hypothetical protein